MRKFGQHFLTSAGIAQKIINAAELTRSDIVLEVGPGRGALTELLVKKAEHVIAIEKDKNLVEFLREKFKDIKNLKIVHGDILKISNEDLTSKIIYHTSYKIVANLPYYITSRFLRLFLEREHKPERMVLMVQKEVAERICRKPPKMSLLGLSVQAYGIPRIVLRVPRRYFKPQPKVDSAVIEIINISNAFFQKHGISPEEFFTLPKKAFSQKRKMLRSSLTRVNVKHSVFNTKRPQELSREEWVFLCALE